MPEINPVPEFAEMEASLLDKAGQIDQMRGEQFAAVAPEGVYGSKLLNKLVKAINKLAPLFDMEALEEYTEDVQGPLPDEIVRALSMIRSATEDAGITDAMFEVADMVDDAAINLVIGKILTLAKDTAFKTFLKSAPREAPVQEPVEAEMGAAPAAAPVPDMAELDNLFASRM